MKKQPKTAQRKPTAPKPKRRATKAPPPPAADPKPRRRRKIAQLAKVKPCRSTTPSEPPDVSARQHAFLAAFQTCCSVKRAAEAAKIPRSLHYQWLNDSAYAQRFEKAQEEAAQVLEDEAVRRAYEGNLEPVFYEGEAVEYILKYSDALLMFLLRGLKAKRYNTQRTELSGPDNGPIPLSNDLLALADLFTPDELRTARARMQAQLAAARCGDPVPGT